MSDKDRFVGVWRLISAETWDGEGRPIPMLRYEEGILYYTHAGRMSGQLYRRDRPKFAGKDWFSGSDQEIRSAYIGYVAYFGTFDVDETEKTIVHHVHASFFPNWEGAEQRRYYQFEGDRLILNTAPGTITDQKASARLTWERVE
jgi:hypothetical protein